MTNEMKNDQTKVNGTKSQPKRTLSLPKVVTSVRAGQSFAHAMPPPGM